MIRFIEKLEYKIAENPVKCVFKWFLVPTGCVILGLAIIFIFKFWDQHYSEDIGDWGTFGDFFGGVLNPFISLISLLLIAFLTIYITGREGQRQFYLEKKVEAYGELMNYYSQLIFLKSTLFNKIELLKKIDDGVLRHKLLSKYKQQIINGAAIFDKFDTYIKIYSIKYSHIFDYDFENHEFEKLKKDSFGVNAALETIKGHIENESLDFEFGQDFSYSFYLRINVFVKRLKEEVDPKAGKKYKKLPIQDNFQNYCNVPVKEVDVFEKGKISE